MSKFNILSGIAMSIALLFNQNTQAQALLFDNGPVFNSVGTGAGGANESVLYTTTFSMGTIGFGQQLTANRVADDFVVSGCNWSVDSIVFFGYQTGSTLTSTFTAVNFMIWDGEPGAPGSNIVYGDSTTNRLSSTRFSGTYRITETTTGNTARPIMRNVCATAGLTLAPGTYWIDWQSGGSLGSGPWQPSRTPVGQSITGNGKQRVGSGAWTWLNAVDGGTGNPAQGFPFEVYGPACPVSNFDCIANTTATPEAPTLALNPANPTGSINASWPVASAPSYTLRWRPQGANGFAQRTVSTNSFSTTAFSQLLSATTYNFWVINRCSNNSADFYTSPVASLATAGPSTGCGVPAVTCGSSTESSISVEWPELSSATRIGARYSFAGQTGYSQSSSIAYATTAGTSTFTFSGLLANQTYTISLFAECEGRIWWSSPITCSTGMMSPRLANNTYTFNFEGDEYVDVKMTDFQFFAPAAGLPNHTVDVSSGQLVVSFEEAAQQAFSFGLLPNVTSDMTNLSFVTSKATDANLSVYSLNGTLVYQQALGQVQNAQRIDLNTTEFAAGVYQVVVQTNDTQYSQKLVVVK